MEPNHEVLATLMKHVLEDPEDAFAKGKRAREDMVNFYSEEAFGLLLEKEFHRITESIIERHNARIHPDEEL